MKYLSLFLVPRDSGGGGGGGGGGGVWSDDAQRNKNLQKISTSQIISTANNILKDRILFGNHAALSL